MGLFSTSVTTNINATGNISNLVKSQNGSPLTPLPTLSAETQKSVTTVLTGTQGQAALTSGVSNFKVTPESVAAAQNTITTNLNITQLSSLANKGATFLNTALSSINSTLSGVATQLASGIDGVLGGIFKNTTIPNASKVTTSISDPVKTNLLGSTAVGGTSFKIGSAEAGSQAITMANSSTTFGSNAPKMVGSSLTTLMDRFSLKDSASLVKSLNSTSTNTILSGLFAKPTTLAQSTTSTTTASPAISTGTNNTLQSILGKTSTLSALTGTSPLTYYTPAPKDPLYSVADGSVITTSSPDASADTANAIARLATSIGCSILDGQEFGSTSETNTLFGNALGLAASNGLDGILSDLLGCNLASSPYAQSSIVTAFNQVSGSNVSTAGILINHVDNPSALNSDGSLMTILANSNLKTTDYPQVEDIMSKIGTTTQQAYCTGTLSTQDLPVYDTKKLTASSPQFVDTVFADKTFSTLFNGRELSLDATGILV